MNDVILITGAAGGIGQCLARQLSHRPVQLVLVDRDARGLAALRAELGEAILTYAADLCDETQLAALIDFVQQRCGRLDALVNNAAIVHVGPLTERSPASIRQELDINLLAPLLLSRLAIPLLQRSTNARLVTTVSLAGIFPTPESPIYCASKFGLRGAMLALAQDLAPQGIRVCCVLPSATDTPMLRHEAIAGGNALQFMDPPQSPETVARLLVRVLDRPRLESAPRVGELWLSRLAMLVPGLLPRLLPYFQRRGERGLRRYLTNLEQRGLAERHEGAWRLRQDGRPD
ncbi:oxidoreductase [Pseudomonas oryzihabitans]|nr:oxidoreductase [Pseudomonas psychrotolerans]